MSVFFICSFLLINIYQGLRRGDSNVCKNEITGALFCCFNHEEINDSCVECEVGFSSINGYPCTPCEEGLYGVYCSMQCECRSDQRCDNEIGCSDFDFQYSTYFNSVETSTGSSLNVTSSVITTNGTTVQTEVSTEKNKHISPETNDQLSTEINKPVTTEVSTETTLSNRMIIGIVAGSSLVYIIFMHILCFVMYKRQHTNNTNTEEILPGNLYDEIGTVHYQFIPIPPIPHRNINVVIENEISDNVNLDANNQSDKTTSSNSVQTDQSSEDQMEAVSSSEDDANLNESMYLDIINEYAEPYSCLTTDDGDVHKYETCIQYVQRSDPGAEIEHADA